jgi:hypothetical protein
MLCRPPGYIGTLNLSYADETKNLNYERYGCRYIQMTSIEVIGGFQVKYSFLFTSLVDIEEVAG